MPPHCNTRMKLELSHLVEAWKHNEIIFRVIKNMVLYIVGKRNRKCLHTSTLPHRRTHLRSRPPTPDGMENPVKLQVH